MTVRLPRKLPKSKEDFEKVKQVFIKYYDLEDDAKTWVTIINHMNSTHGTKTRKAYIDLINPAKRLKTNQILQNILQEYILELQTDLAIKMEALAKEQKPTVEVLNGNPS